MPIVQLTEFADWRDVTKWAMGIYAAPAQTNVEIDRVVAKIMAASTDPDKRIEAALDFVQRDIRYFALSLGESSHRPAPPATVLRRRFGDCKDKTGLLIAMLRKMSIDAYPALVSARLRHTVGDFLPAVATFDHMIVALPRESGYLWLDGTNAFQAGSLEARDARWHGKALVVRDDGDMLTPMPALSSDASVFDVTERYTVKTGGQAATLDLAVNLSGSYAETLRAVMKQKDQETALSLFTDFYRRRYPAIRPTVPAALRDDRDGKPAVITASFEVPGLFRYQNGILLTYAVNGAAMDLIPLPSMTSRRAPFYLSIPSRARLQSEYLFPESRRFPPPPPPIRVSGRQFTFGSETVANDRTVKVTSEMRLSRETVNPAELTEYLTSIKRAQEAGAAPVIYPLVDIDRINEIMRRSDFNVLPGFPLISRGTPAARIRTRHQQALELLDEAMASRIVDDRLRSDLRVERAVQLSYLGQKPQALSEISKVLAAMPERADALMIRAEIKARTGNYAESSQDIVSAQAAGADPLAVARLRGEVAYFTGDLANAEAAWRELTSMAPAAERYYALVWFALTEKKKGEGVEAVVRELDTLGGSDWPRPIAEHLAGRLTESELLKSIGKEDPETSIQRYCEAYFYLGQQALIAGRASEATDYFRKTINTDVQAFVEWQYATLELARMNGQGR
jgi:lipoprotein NlpI